MRVRPDAVIDEVISIWGEHLREHGDATIGPLLIQQAPAVEHHGNAWTSTGVGRDIATIATSAHPYEVALERLLGWERTPIPPEIEPMLARVQALLRDVRRWLGGDHWAIEWVDDGSTCWLLSVQPCESARSQAATGVLVPLAGRDRGPFTPLVADAMCAAVDRVWSRVTTIDSGFSGLAPPACIAHGRLYIDVADTATALNTVGIGTADLFSFVPQAYQVRLPPRAGRLMRAVGRGPALRLLVAHLTAVLTTPRPLEPNVPMTSIQAIADLFASTAELYERIFWRTAHVWLAATAAAGSSGQSAILTALQGKGDPSRHAAHAAMRRLAEDYPSVRKAIERGELPEDEEFRAIWSDYARRWGMRADNELELAYERDRERLSAVMRDILAQDEAPVRLHGMMGFLLRPLLARAAQLGGAFARDLDAARGMWLAAGEWLTGQGLIGTRDDVWLMTCDDLDRLSAGWQPEGDFWTRRRAAWAALQAREADLTIDRVFCTDQGKEP